MSIVSRKSGEQVHCADGISVRVLGIEAGEIKLGICSGMSGPGCAAPHEQLASVCCRGPRYFLFPQGGARTLVVRCEKGKSLSFNGTSTLTVLDIAEGVATLGLAPRDNAALVIDNNAKRSIQEPPEIDCLPTAEQSAAETGQRDAGVTGKPAYR